VPIVSTPRATETAASSLEGLKLVELRAIAKNRGLKGYTKLRKAELLDFLNAFNIE